MSERITATVILEYATNTKCGISTSYIPSNPNPIKILSIMMDEREAEALMASLKKSLDDIKAIRKAK